MIILFMNGCRPIFNYFKNFRGEFLLLSEICDKQMICW
jgi:hypothetical protein